MANCAGLASTAPAGHPDSDIEFAIELSRVERLANHHSGSFAAEVFVQRAAVDCNTARAAGEINAGH